MGKVLLTGGNGFIASHVLTILLAQGYTVVTTVRSPAKGQQILASHPDKSAEELSFLVVEDVGREGTWDEVLKDEPSIEYVVHTASPFPTSFEDPVRDVLAPAVKGTTGILAATKKYGHQVKRVVITSSFAAMVNTEHPPAVYDETSWNPITWEQAVNHPNLTYRGSKALAEKAAWDFMEREKPAFDLVALNPPLVYGPVAHHLESLSVLNTSNQKIRDFIQGKIKGPELPPTGTYLFTDVRDIALAHVNAIHVAEAGSQRFFITSGHCSHKRMVDAIARTHPEISARLPQNPLDDFPAEVYGYNNSKAVRMLGIEFHSLSDCMRDTTTSLLKFESE